MEELTPFAPFPCAQSDFKLSAIPEERLLSIATQKLPAQIPYVYGDSAILIHSQVMELQSDHKKLLSHHLRHCCV